MHFIRSFQTWNNSYIIFYVAQAPTSSTEFDSEYYIFLYFKKDLEKVKKWKEGNR